MPSNETIYNPISKKQIDLGKTDQYRWEALQNPISERWGKQICLN